MFVGRVVGQALTDSYVVKKVGFTGSTAVGKTVMKRWSMYNPTINEKTPLYTNPD